MKNNFIEKFSHKFFTVYLLVFGVIYLLDSLWSFFAVRKAKSLFGDYGVGDLFGINNINLKINPTGGSMFIMALIFVLFVVGTVLYMLKVVKEDKVTVFRIVPISLALITILLVFNTKFVVSSFNFGFNSLLLFLIIISTGLLSAFTILSRVRGKVIIYKNFQGLINEFKSTSKKVSKEKSDLKQDVSEINKEENN